VPATPDKLSNREAAYVGVLKQLCPPIAAAQQLLTTFRAILAKHDGEGLDPWLQPCEQSGISEPVGIARGLRRDYSAVRAALRYDWSQGFIEGHINRLKMLGRQMYGRAGFPSCVGACSPPWSLKTFSMKAACLRASYVRQSLISGSRADPRRHHWMPHLTRKIRFHKDLTLTRCHPLTCE
jgi:Transposase